jgi:hypothetical protein
MRLQQCSVRSGLGGFAQHHCCTHIVAGHEIVAGTPLYDGLHGANWEGRGLIYDATST